MLSIRWKSWFRPEASIRRIEQGGKEAARLCAEYVAERARIYCPVVSGDLRGSIKAVPSRAGARWNVVATMPYARRIEYGSVQGGTFIAPQPYLRRALADGRKRFPELLKQVGPLARGYGQLGITLDAGA